MNSLTWHTTRLSPWVIFLALFNIILHWTFYNTLGFHRDELLYFSLGQHLSAGYASVPPFIGFMAWFMINTLGYSLLSARLLPMLLSGVMVIIVALITMELKGKTYAQVLATIAFIVTPFNLRTYFLFMPVCFDCFFWSIIILVILRWINTKDDRYLLLLGLAAGLGMLNKYLIAVEIFAILSVLIFSEQRKIFTTKCFWFAILIAFLVLSPNLIWQLKNNLPVLTHMQALHDSQLVHVSRISFFTDQLFIACMAIFLVIPGLIYAFTFAAMKPYRPLMVASLLVLLILVLLRGKSYYTIGLYPFWIAAGGVFWENRIRHMSIKIVLPLIIVLLTLPVLPYGLPVFKPARLVEYFAGARKSTGFDAALRWETGQMHNLPQDYADMLGWEEIAAITAKAYQQVNDKTGCMIYAENYGEAGAVMVLGKKYGLPEPVCFSESFWYWFPRNPPHEITEMIYINDKLGDDIKGLFADCRLVGQVSDTLAREYGTEVWLCKNPKTSFNEFWKQRTPQVANPFR
ncbi:MAG: glycosyltransferase family 39 protein [Bacteroidota bacterium]|jgi:Dolichyl-phosphate-mannose-protein mannosyltransferase